MVYGNVMATAQKTVRHSVRLPPKMARRVKALAKQSKSSVNRVLVDLIETGIAAKEREKEHFLELTERLARASDKKEQARIKRELARRTFGE